MSFGGILFHHTYRQIRIYHQHRDIYICKKFVCMCEHTHLDLYISYHCPPRKTAVISVPSCLGREACLPFLGRRFDPSFLSGVGLHLANRVVLYPLLGSRAADLEIFGMKKPTEVFLGYVTILFLENE